MAPTKHICRYQVIRPDQVGTVHLGIPQESILGPIFYIYCVYLLSSASTLVAEGTHQAHLPIAGNSAGSGGKSLTDTNCISLSTIALNFSSDNLQMNEEKLNH